MEKPVSSHNHHEEITKPTSNSSPFQFLTLHHLGAVVCLSCRCNAQQKLTSWTGFVRDRSEPTWSKGGNQPNNQKYKPLATTQSILYIHSALRSAQLATAATFFARCFFFLLYFFLGHWFRILGLAPSNGLWNTKTNSREQLASAYSAGSKRVRSGVEGNRGSTSNYLVLSC